MKDFIGWIYCEIECYYRKKCKNFLLSEGQMLINGDVVLVFSYISW